MKKYRAYSQRCENGWNEQIVVYENDLEVARSCRHHPQGSKTFVFDGFEFLSLGLNLSGNYSECYVRVSDGLYFNSELPNADFTKVEDGCLKGSNNIKEDYYGVIYVDLSSKTNIVIE
jgi:hypothetical protein